MSKELGIKLKYMRSRMNFTQQQIADQLNVDRSTYSNYERAVTEPDIKTLLKLARIFDVDVNELLSDTKAVARVADSGGMPVYSLTKEERSFVVTLRVLTPEQKKAVFDYMNGLKKEDKKNSK